MLDRKCKMHIKIEVMAKLAVANLTWLRGTWALLFMCECQERRRGRGRRYEMIF